AVGREDQDRSQKLALDRHDPGRIEPGQIGRRGLRPRRARTNQGAALLISPQPHLLSASRICPGTGAVIATGGLFLEIGTTISRECRCKGAPPKETELRGAPP